MELKLINEVLADLSYPQGIKGVSLLDKVNTKERPDMQGGEPLQGGYDEYYKVFKLPVEGVFLKLTYRTDSYGDNDSLHSIQFVKETQKKVTIYEAI
jgi:hypothetical protein